MTRRGRLADHSLFWLTDLLAKQKLPWTHRWDGSESGHHRRVGRGGVSRRSTSSTPRGVIRHKGLRGEELEKAMNALLDETNSKPAKEA